MRPYLLWLLASLLVVASACPIGAFGERVGAFCVGLAVAAVLYAELEAKA